MKNAPCGRSGLSCISALPYSGNVEINVKAAQDYSRYAVDNGYIPIAPHLLFPQFLNDDILAERQLGLFFGDVLMSKCSEVWVFGSVISAGMEAEIKRAQCKNYHLRYFTESCEEVNHARIKDCAWQFPSD